VVFAPGQPEYGANGRHNDVHDCLRSWLSTLDCARVPVDTRLACDDWSTCATPDQFLALVKRFDAVITTRLHGLVLALHASVPALAVDPIHGGGKVTAQADALGWPAAVDAEGSSDRARLNSWWRWCLSAAGRTAAARQENDSSLVEGLLMEVCG
jgi:hypothetical protein